MYMIIFFFCIQILLFLKGFTEDQRSKLATVTGIILANGEFLCVHMVNHIGWRQVGGSQGEWGGRGAGGERREGRKWD